ncbi:MAG: peptidase S41 [Acidobacteria bacterium RIFCSPLOWO2_02_FULL_59_13]|nr:MAG: peptidase S41 [Acidobacteria bacterium RIFCSPLOWO2_02_FULL_59_13]
MYKTTRKIRGLVLVLVAILICAAAGGLFVPRVTAETASEDTELRNSLQKVSRVWQTVEQHYAEPVEAEKVIYNGAIPGMLRSLDPHSNFFDPKSFALLREEQRGRYYGVGMTVTPRDGKTIVLAPFVGSPAYKAGLRPGDVIVQVDETPTDNLTTTEVAELLKGPKGTTVRILVLREGDPEPLPFMIVRDEIPRLSIEHAFRIAPDVGYIRIASFNETTSKELRDQLEEMQTGTLKGLVLDLRNNPGGLLAEGVNVADVFLQRGQLIVSHRGRASREKRYFATRGNRGQNFPLVVLINRFTASAAEIVSGAVQDHDRGLIVGEASFGKGLVQTVYPLSENTGLALTTAKYYTPSGRLIQREYSGVSLYDYFNNKENKDNGGSGRTDVRTTDSGRPVYGGGGISPDAEIPERQLNRFQESLVRSYAFFNFARRYLAEHKTIPSDFEVADAVQDRFRQFLQEEKISFTEAELMENQTYIRNSIKMELVLSVFGMNEAYKLEAAADPQIQKAIELLPQAAALLENAKQMMARKEIQ